MMQKIWDPRNISPLLSAGEIGCISIDVKAYDGGIIVMIEIPVIPHMIICSQKMPFSTKAVYKISASNVPMQLNLIPIL